MELNPVRARMIDDPADYPWSSFRWHAGVSSEFKWMDVDPCYEALGNSEDERAMRYTEFVHRAIPDGE